MQHFDPNALIWLPLIILVVMCAAYGILWICNWAIPECDFDDSDISDLEIMMRIARQGCRAVECDRFCDLAGCRADRLYADKAMGLKRRGKL